MKTAVGIVIGIVIAIIGFVAFSFVYPQTAQAPNSNGNGNGTTTPGDTTNPDIADLISVSTPTKNQKISSPVTITGQARGTWYFEASFPIEILDSNGTVIGQGHGEAKSDWMTEDFVPFSATITFTSLGAGKTGTIRLKNDNPSGDPARDKHIDIPVTF
jgi:hypothetical protein